MWPLRKLMGLNQANLSDDGWEVIVDPLYIYMIYVFDYDATYQL